MPVKPKKTAQDILIELYAAICRPPEVEGVGKWLADLQSLHHAYQRAVKSEKRRKKAVEG